MFVLMGNFNSSACTGASCDYGAVRSNFGLLAGLLSRFPRILVC